MIASMAWTVRFVAAISRCVMPAPRVAMVVSGVKAVSDEMRLK